MKRLDSRTFVSGQIGPADVAAVRELGVTMIVNNRPDGEEPGQPANAEIAAAAERAGIGYRHIPVAGGLAPDAVASMAEVLEREMVTLAFCKSGTRSTLLWALARARIGDDPAELAAKAEAAGHSLAPIAPLLQSH